MLLTITTTHRPATDLGYLLHKHPARFQSTKLSFGQVHVFYPVATDALCTAALLLDVDPIEMVRGRGKQARHLALEHYINDRSYAASSFLSVALARVFGSALRGACEEKPGLADTRMPLQVRITVLPCRGGEMILRRLFEPLGYHVWAERHALDETFPEWGESPYYSVELEKMTRLSELLTHLYVLVPVLDNQKHYFIGRDEVEKLLRRGKGWLKDHPERAMIARRYLKHRSSLAQEALTRLAEDDPQDKEQATGDESDFEGTIESELNLNETRLADVVAVLESRDSRSVIDLGCGEGKLLRLLLKNRRFEKIAGLDVSIRALEIAARRLRLDTLAPRQRDRVELLHGSLMYRDKRLEGYDAATIVEVIEHLDLPRLAAFERVVFEFAKPRVAIVTTPNREFNGTWENLKDGRLRHKDHRFEWTRREFQAWAQGLAKRFNYAVQLRAIGTERESIGSPTQMAVFAR